MATIQAPTATGGRGASGLPWKNRFLLVTIVTVTLAGAIVGLTARSSSVSHGQAEARNEPVFMHGRNLQGLSPLEPVYMHGRNLQGLSPLEPVYMHGRNLQGLSPLPAEEPRVPVRPEAEGAVAAAW